MTAKSCNDTSPDPYTDKTSNKTQRAEVAKWRCMNCGQYIFVVIDTNPPDICEFCDDMTTWEFIETHT